MHRLRRICVVCALFVPGIGMAQDGTPLSAIDWLSQSVETPVGALLGPGVISPEPPVSTSALSPPVSVQTLGGPSIDTIGLLPPSVTGFPRTLWSASDAATLTDLVRAERVDTLPALQDLLLTLMTAEADAPLNGNGSGALFLARVDKLLDLGAIEPAQSMIEAAGPDTPDLFRRWFDLALLTGTEQRACDALREKPDVAPTYPVRIFCLARAGDWSAAALILNTGRAIGDITPEENALLSRFLDPDLFEGEPPLPPPTRPSPLVFRLREAVGERMSTATLPRAFAHADLGDGAGWRNQMEAAERLVRNGALSENVLQALYTARRPAASGGIWDRAAAIQSFETALASGDPDRIAETLRTAWPAMVTARLEVAFARLYAAQLSDAGLSGEAGSLAFEIGLLSPDYETVANAASTTTPRGAFLRAVALGDGATAVPATARDRAIVAGFTDAPPPELAALAGDGKLGEALLRALALIDQGLTGDPRAVGDGIAFLRSVGLEDVARRTALQYLLLDRPT